LEPVEIVPISTSGDAGGTEITEEETATVAPNTGEEVDSVVRPLYDGVMTFQAIRSESDPETYSWEVRLEPDQELKQISEQQAQVYYEGGHTAATINAVPAHDAVGTEVPTTLTVSGRNIVTLTVRHRNHGFVYPVIAGAGWQGGFQTSVVEMPPSEPLPGQEEYWESDELVVGPPEPVAPAGGATESATGEARRQFIRAICGHSEFYSGGYSQECGNPFLGQPGFSTPWQAAMRGAFYYKPDAWAEQRGAKACAGASYDASVIAYYQVKEAYQCHYGPQTEDGNGGAKVSAGHYFRAQAHWEVGHLPKCAGETCPGNNPTIWEDKALELHLWPSGAVQKVVP
jgi:hypothetical protein